MSRRGSKGLVPVLLVVSFVVPVLTAGSPSADEATVAARIEESLWHGALEAEGSSRPDWWQEARARFPVGTDPEDFAGCIEFVQVAYAEKGRPRRAIRLFAETAEAARAAGDVRAWLRACHEIAHLYGGALQDHARALGWALRCARTPLADPVEARQNRIASELAAARAVEGLGHRELAVELYRMLVRELERDPDPYGTLLLPRIHLRIADAELAAGDTAAAEAAYRETRAAAERLPEQAPSNYRAPGSVARAALRRLAAPAVDRLDRVRIPDGSYRGEAYGYNAPVGVRLTFEAGRCTKLHVTDLDDKRPLDAYRVLPQRILDTQSLDVDAVTGATVTSRAILSAATEAVFQAGEERAEADGRSRQTGEKGARGGH